MEVLSSTEKILIIQTAFIGDAILTLPMIERLQEQFPSAVLDVLAIPTTREIFTASPFVSEVIVLDKKKTHKSFFSLYKFANEIKHRNYSRIYSPHRSFRTSFIVMQSGVKETYGFSTASAFHVYKNVVEYNFNVHEVQRNLDLIGYEYSSESWKIVPKLNVTHESQKKVGELISSIGNDNKLIAITPGSIWETKKYPEKYFREIIKYFVEHSYKILVMGGESDKELCIRLASAFDKNVYSIGGKFSIIESIEILKKARLLLTNDSAPTHFGMCADIPVLTIYCSTVPGFGFYPYNKKSLYISYEDLICKPCGIHGYNFCPAKHFDCGNKLLPQIIISKMEEMLSDSN